VEGCSRIFRTKTDRAVAGCLVNRTGISAPNAGSCMGSLVAFLRGAVIGPVHIELVLGETLPG